MRAPWRLDSARSVKGRSQSFDIGEKKSKIKKSRFRHEGKSCGGRGRFLGCMVVYSTGWRVAISRKISKRLSAKALPQKLHHAGLSRSRLRKMRSPNFRTRRRGTHMATKPSVARADLKRQSSARTTERLPPFNGLSAFFSDFVGLPEHPRMKNPTK